MEAMKIGEVAQQAGIETSAIRYYESIGLLPAPHRANCQRRYDASILARLNMILAAREIGFSLDEIRTLLDSFPERTPPSERWQSLAATKLTEIEATLDHLLRMKHLLEAGLRCECVEIEQCFGKLGR